MGVSKSYRGGPGWEGRNQPGKDSTALSKGGHGKLAEGTHASGEGGGGRHGMSRSAHKKSRSTRGTAMAKVPGGES